MAWGCSRSSRFSHHARNPVFKVWNISGCLNTKIHPCSIKLFQTKSVKRKRCVDFPKKRRYIYGKRSMDSILSYRTIFSAIVFYSIAPITLAQDLSKRSHDSTIVFGQIQAPQGQTVINTLRNSWGINLLVSTNGFGLGSFYRHEYSDELSGFVDFSISEASDDNEKNYIDPYTGQT